MRTLIAILAMLAVPAAASAQARDRDNPTCPPVQQMSFSSFERMSFTLEQRGGLRVLIADGGVDTGAAARSTRAEALGRGR
jgi:hypothetical protein